MSANPKTRSRAAVIRDNVTLSEIMAVQIDYLAKAAERATERGYCVVISGANKDLKPEDLKYPFGYMVGGLAAMIRTWNASRKAHVLMIYVTLPKDGAQLKFYCEIPNRAWARELVVAVKLYSRFGKEKRDKVIWEGSGGLFTMVENPNLFKVTGVGNDKIKSFITMLEMPQHQSLLLGKG